MKLLMISGDRTVAAGKSGAFSETLKELHTHFERIDILCPRVFTDQQVRVIHGNVYLHPANGGLLSQPSFILRKGKELYNTHHHDVMTVHEYPPFYNGIGARRLKKAIGIPAALEIHHIVGWPKASSYREYIGRIFSRLFLASHTKHFEAVRVVNETVKNLLIMWGVAPEKIHVVSSVYLNHRYLSVTQDRKKLYDLTFCARLVENKGLLETIEAIKLLPGRRLQIIGDGPLKKRAGERIESLGLTSRVDITAWLGTEEDVFIAMALGKVFVMNSKSEGNPRVAIEAMALGIPVLATKVGIMPDVIEDGVNGMFTDGTAKDIAKKAEALLLDDERIASMGAKAALVTQRFEKKAAIRAYADFLKSFTRV